MQKCTIYVRVYKRRTLQGVLQVKMKEIADIATSPKIKTEIDKMIIFEVPDSEKDARYIITIVDVINAIWKLYPEADIQSIGEMDTVIDYRHKKLSPNQWWEWTKVIIVCLVVFAGAAVAVMTYNTDAALGKTFILINKIVTGNETKGLEWITIPYSIGITIGVVFFFNHIGSNKITDDPTPMEVEIQKYEQDVEECEIEGISDRRRGES